MDWLIVFSPFAIGRLWKSGQKSTAHFTTASTTTAAAVLLASSLISAD
jgi:hypothetical protein